MALSPAGSWLLTVLLTLPGHTEEGMPLRAGLTEAALFKNGLAFLVREVAIPGPGSWVLSELPIPAHGTFWVLPDSGVTLKQVTTRMQASTRQEPIAHLAAVVGQNAGKTLALKTPDGWVVGEVVGAPSATPPGPAASDEAASAEGPVSRPPSTFVLLKTDKGLEGIPLDQIKGFRATGTPLRLEQPITTRSAALHLQTAGSKGRVTVLCLARGMSWAPSYLVDITHPTEAVVRGKAVILNDLEDVKDLKLQAVAGFPNMQFSHVLDASHPGQSLQGFLNQLGEGSSSRGSYVISQQAVMSNYAPFTEPVAVPPPPGAGESHQDLFFHRLEPLNLKKGERAYQPMFEHRVPYEHVYVWEVRGEGRDAERWREDRDSRSGPVREEVWHQLRLKHTGAVPWSTGPAMTVQQGRILGQDTLYFTQAGSETLVRITRAMDVQAEQLETEIHRERSVATPYSGSWDRVKVRGELQVVNHQAKKVSLLIKKQLQGEWVEGSQNPTVRTQAEGLKKANPQQQVAWDLVLAPRQKQRITYTYTVLVSR